jgi:RND family efflux transporter MFP subunit
MNIKICTRRLTRLVGPCCLALALACGGSADKADAPTAPERATRPPKAVQAAPVERMALDQTIKMVGTLFGNEQLTISAQVPGRIERTLVDIGDRVNAGAELLRIEPTDLQLVVNQNQLAMGEALAKLGLDRLPTAEFNVEAVATVARAHAQAANARVKLDRARQLFQKKPPLLSEQEFNDLQTAYDVANGDYEVARLEARAQLATARSRQSQLESARKQLADTIVLAPQLKAHDAITSLAVTRRFVTAGEYVRIGDPLFTLVQDDPVKLRGAVPERYLAQIRTGMACSLKVESYSELFSGSVSRINPAIDSQSRTFEVEVSLPNPGRKLRPGAFAECEVVVGRQARVALIPRQAVVSFAGIDRLFSVKDGKAQAHLVKLGAAHGEQVAILQGLPESVQQVVLAADLDLSDQDSVMLQKVVQKKH